MTLFRISKADNAAFYIYYKNIDDGLRIDYYEYIHRTSGRVK